MTAIRTVAETGSTNADMLDMARVGAAEGTWLRAERQYRGRGRQGRDWASPPGNFHGSTLVRLRPADPLPATLALAAGIAVEDAVRTLLSGGPGVAASALKWPNDVLVNGAKIAGILLERADDAVVVGIGINLANHPDLPDRATTSLAAHGAAVTADDAGALLADLFARWLACWRGQGLDPIRRRWVERAHPIGTAITARLPDGTSIDGLFDGLAADGALTLRLAGGERHVIHAAEIFLV